MMKNLHWLFLFISVIGNAQTYQFGACYTNSNYIKAEGTFTIGDKKVSIEAIENKNKTVVEYEAFKGNNGVIYITDGAMIHTLNILEEKGKKKGFEHEVVIILTLDQKKDGAEIKYYCKKKE